VDEPEAPYKEFGGKVVDYFTTKDSESWSEISKSYKLHPDEKSLLAIANKLKTGSSISGAQYHIFRKDTSTICGF
jgi:hypothetical protein